MSIVFQLHTSEQVGFTLGTDEFSSQHRQQEQYRRPAQPHLPQQQQVGKFSRQQQRQQQLQQQQQRQQQLQQQQLQQRQLAEELLEHHLTTTTEELVTTSTTRNVLNIETQDLVSLSLAGTRLVWQHYLASALGANDTQHEVDKRLNLAQPCRPSVS